MKASAASAIGHCERSVDALGDCARTVDPNASHARLLDAGLQAVGRFSVARHEVRVFILELGHSERKRVL